MTAILDASALKPGDVAGLALFNRPYAWLGVERGDDGLVLLQFDEVRGSTDRAALKGTRVWLRADCDFVKNVASFHYSTDGTSYSPIGVPHVMAYGLITFQGVRYSLFSYHTQPDAEGGFADFDAVDVAETSKPSIPYGKRIQLSVRDAGALLTLDKADGFTVDDRGLGRVALSTDGSYVSVDTSGAVSLRRGPAGDAETFQWMDTFNGDLVLLSIATKRYLRVDAAGRILADSPGPRPDSRDGVRFRWQIKPDETSPQRPVIPQQLSFVPYHASGIYDVGETVGWTVTPGPTTPTYAYKWTIRRNNAVVLKEGRLDLSSGKDTIAIQADQPEMLYVAIEPAANPSPSASTPASDEPHFIGGNTGRDTGLYAVGAAVAPTKIGLSTPRPADFDAFWESKLAAQAKIPIKAVLTPVESPVQGVEMNIFALDALGSKAHGYIARPSGEGRFPAVIQMQYAGVYALNAVAVARRASEGWLMLNVDSHDKLPSDPSGNVPRNYREIGNTDRETSYFLNMYLRDSRVLDYLMTRSDWDGKTIVLMGGSMGGQQSLALAGLRPENISAVLVCVPAGADTNGDLHGRKAGYPNWPSDNPDAMKTALYFDPVNFASRIKAPVLAGMGFIDTISPPAGIWTMLNQVHGAVEALPLIESEHDNFTPEKERACPARTTDILDVMVHGGQFTPNVLK